MALTKVIGSGVQGISNSSDATALEITSSEDIVIKHNTNNAKLVFNDQSNSSNFFIQQIGSSGSPALRFFESTGDERMRIHNGGVLSVNQGIALGVGSNNTSSNVLDDYEEGTADLAFSSIGSSFNYTYRKCYYTKVGNLVNIIVYMQLDGSNTFSANTVSITGLPFTSVDEAAHQSSSACRVRFFNFDSGFTYLMATVGQNTTEVGLLECGDNTAPGGVVANQLSSSSGQTLFNLSYRVP